MKTNVLMENLLSLEQPKTHYAMTGFNVMPIQLDDPIDIILYDKYPAKVVSTNGLDVKGRKTFGVNYGPNLKWYIKISENELTESFVL